VLTSAGLSTPFRYGGASGCQTDADTGLVLMGHRYYDTRIGRFISQDPAGDGDNWYVYCRNNPVDNTDPSGLFDGSPPADGQWGFNSGTMSDTASALGQVQSDSLSSYSTYASTVNLYLNRYTSYDNGQSSQLTGQWLIAPWMLGGGFCNLSRYPSHEDQPESLGHYLLRQFLSGGQADNHHLGPPAGLFGSNPNVAKNQINTNAKGGRAAAKSLFRKLSKGKKVLDLLHKC